MFLITIFFENICCFEHWITWSVSSKAGSFLWSEFFEVKRFICHVWPIPRIRSNFGLEKTDSQRVGEKEKEKKLNREVTATSRSKIFKRFRGTTKVEMGQFLLSKCSSLCPWERNRSVLLIRSLRSGTVRAIER